MRVQARLEVRVQVRGRCRGWGRSRVNEGLTVEIGRNLAKNQRKGASRRGMFRSKEDVGSGLKKT